MNSKILVLALVCWFLGIASFVGFLFWGLKSGRPAIVALGIGPGVCFIMTGSLIVTYSLLRQRQSAPDQKSKPA